MTVQPIGSTNIALYITSEDLKEWGLTPDGLTLERALVLARDAFVQTGLEMDGALEIEAYPDACGVLVFVRAQAPAQVWFSFPDLETLLTGARSLRGPCADSMLFWWEGRYWLSLPEREEARYILLSEFGRTEGVCPWQEARLTEYGRQIWGDHALDRLRALFPV